MGFKSLGLKLKMILGNTLPLVIVIALGVVVYLSINSLLQASHWVDHTHKVVQEAMKIEAAAVDMETGMRGYLLAGKEEFLDPYKGGRERFGKLVAHLKETVSDNPTQVARLGEVEKTIAEWQTNVTEPAIELRRQIGDAKTMNDMAKLVGQAKGKAYFDKFRGQIKTFIDRETKLMGDRQTKAAEANSAGDQSLDTMDQNNEWVQHTYKVLAKAQGLLASVVDMETGLRGFLLSGQDSFLDPYKAGKKSFDTNLEDLKKTVSDNPGQVKRLDSLAESHNAWQKNWTEPLIKMRRDVDDGLKTMGYLTGLVAQAKGKKYVDAMRGILADFSGEESALLDKRNEAFTDSQIKLIESRNLAKKTTGWVEHTYKVIASANDIIASAVDMETGMRGYLLAGKEGFLEPYKNGSSAFDQRVAGLRKTVNDNPAQVKLLGEIQTTIDGWRKDVVEPMIALRRQIGDAKTMDDMADLVGEARGKVYFDKFRGLIADFRKMEEGLMVKRQADAQETAADTRNVVIGGIAITVVIALVIAFLMSNAIARQFKRIFQGVTRFSTGELNDLQKQFKNVIGSLSAGSGQVASASQGIASGAAQQAASLEETSASLEEMSAMTKNNEANANEANALMQQTSQVVHRANTSMTELTTAMDQIAEASNETAKIVKSIDEIAFQTNLLALNAAVEAARAGEAGMGFAVVADEVRALAMRAAEAAKNTADLIQDTVAKVENGAGLVATTNEAFTEVAHSSDKVGQLINEISNASQEQTRGIDSLNIAVAEMDKVVQSNAASTEELSGQAEELSGSVGILVMVCEGDSCDAGTLILDPEPAGQPSAGQSAYSPPAKARQTEVRPEEMIPFDEDNLEDF